MSATQVPVPAQRPVSDVSAPTGWLGLGALTIYLMICHFWPEIVTTFGLPSRAERLTGPNAALLGLVITAAPMSAWSLLVA